MKQVHPCIARGGLSLAAVLLVVLEAAPAQQGAGKIEITVVDKKSGKPVPCRIHLKDAAGKPQRAGMLPFWHDHFVCSGTAALDLAPGEYAYEVERGPEYSRPSGTFTLKANETATRKIELERLIDLPAEGWWPGDLHIHRPVEDIELLMQAEDLHIGPVITWWNNRNQWANQKRLPEQFLTHGREVLAAKGRCCKRGVGTRLQEAELIGDCAGKATP